MTDTINKPSIQIRSGLPSPLSDKSPSPATKLLISHGKPNFTIARSPKVDDNVNPLPPQPSANNNYNPYKCASNMSASNNISNGNSNGNGNGNGNGKFVVGTKFNGIFKPSTAVASWVTNGNGNANGSAEQNEAAKVVLRRPKLADVEPLAAVASEEENVPEFIRRQRRIQERLAKENVLDFENRRSGYFTHVMISPDSPNRTSFIETMASPAIVPALEMPLPARIEEEEQHQLYETPDSNGHSETEPHELLANGHSDSAEYVAPEEVAEAIEEVNKAVAGEDDGTTKIEADEVLAQAEEAVAAVLVAAAAELEPAAAVAAPAVELETAADAAPAVETEPIDAAAADLVLEPVVATAAADLEMEPVLAAAADLELEPIVVAAVTPAVELDPIVAAVEPEPIVAVEPVPSAVEAHVEVVTPAAPALNGDDETITISHTNGQTSDVPSIATPDASGALGVNYEPKQVVSFAQELGSAENNYPDTVQVIKELPASQADAELLELSKLKFDIQSDEQNEVQVTPVLRAD